MKNKILGVLAVLPVALLSVASVTAPAQAADGLVSEDLTRVSVGSDGQQGDKKSDTIALSVNGQYVVFASEATNLVPGDTNGKADIFVRDAVKNVTERVSVATGGGQTQGANAFLGQASSAVDISGDGRYVVFGADATDLVEGDTNRQRDIFVHDRRDGVTTRVSVGANGEQANSLSTGASLSEDGRYVVFSSSATNLVPGDAGGGLFIRDLREGVTRRVARDGSEAQISADGGKVVFTSFQSDLVPGDTNGIGDVFLADLGTGTTVRASVATGGAQGEGTRGRVGSIHPSISADGSKISFFSDATGMVQESPNSAGDTYLRNLDSGVTERVSVTPSGAQGDGTGYADNAISPDGRFVAFTSRSSNLAAGGVDDTNGVNDAFIRDLETKTTTRVSVSASGSQANSEITEVALSRNGSHIAFDTRASNLVAGDTNGVGDVFRR